MTILIQIEAILNNVCYHMVCGLDTATLGYVLNNLHICLYEQHVHLFDFCMYNTRHNKYQPQFHSSILYTQHLNYAEIYVRSLIDLAYM